MVAAFLIILIRPRNFFLYNIEHISQYQQGLVFIFLVVLSFLYFQLVLRLINLDKKLLALAAILIGLAAMAIPFFSVDITAYLLAAKNWVIYQNNPYHLPLNYYQGDSWVRASEIVWVWWLDYPSIYGPLLLFISGFVVKISGGQFITAVYLFKSIVLITAALSCYLFIKLDSSPKKSHSLLFLLNPILILSIIVDGHNDVFVLLGLMLFLYFIKQGKPSFGAGAIFLGAMVKFTSLVLLPALLIGKKKQHWISGLILICSIVALSAGFFWVFNIQPTAYLLNPALAVNKTCLYNCTPIVGLIGLATQQYDDLMRVILFSVIYLLLCYRYLFRYPDLFKFSFWAFISLLFVLSKTYLPWYAICPIAVGLLVNDKKYRFLVFALTMYSLLFYFGI